MLACRLSKSRLPAAFRRLCVETAIKGFYLKSVETQPPSGGCVLKPRSSLIRSIREAPAAFRRLCVETCRRVSGGRADSQPPSGGCVLKPFGTASATEYPTQPPSGGCVLKR